MVFAISPLDHVLDTAHWELFESIDLGFKLPWPLTKFIVLQVIAAGLICFFYIRLANRVKDGKPPTGWGWNALESLLTFIRNEVAKPTLHDDTDRFVPFLWTVFLYIMVNNLMGVFPFMGSATGSILVTAALAICAAAVIHGAAIYRHGPVGYLKSYVPHIDAPGGAAIAIGIAGMEIVGHAIKTFVLAVRLFANIFAGHTVLAVILSFIYIAGRPETVSALLFAPISIGSVLFIVALSLLEIFVALLQAYVFTFLTSLFLGMTLHPEH
jgi:F-type H+-transporting ATPase subunit a